jgi:hypothetical protein
VTGRLLGSADVKGRATRRAVAGIPVILLAVVMLVVVGIVPTFRMGSPTSLRGARRGGRARGSPGYMDAYRQADEEHRVPWPILAAMGFVLTENGARSPYDTL